MTSVIEPAAVSNSNLLGTDVQLWQGLSCFPGLGLGLVFGPVTGVSEVGYAVIAGATQEAAIIRIDPRYFRPTEVETLLGDPTKAKQKLGWMPEITLDQMITEMAATDLAEAKKHALLKQHGYNVNVSVE